MKAWSPRAPLKTSVRAQEIHTEGPYPVLPGQFLPALVSHLPFSSLSHSSTSHEALTGTDSP